MVPLPVFSSLSHSLLPPPFSLRFILHTLPSPFSWSCTHAGMSLIMWLHAPPSFLPSLPYISCVNTTRRLPKSMQKAYNSWILLRTDTPPPLNSSHPSTMTHDKCVLRQSAITSCFHCSSWYQGDEGVQSVVIWCPWLSILISSSPSSPDKLPALDDYDIIPVYT